MTMTEMYSKNHAVSYKLHAIKQTVNTINCNVANKHTLSSKSVETPRKVDNIGMTPY